MQCKKVLLLACFAWFGLSRCSEKKNETVEVKPIEEIPIELQVIRSEAEMFQAKSTADVEKWLLKHPLLSRQFIGMDQYPDPKYLQNAILQLVQTPAFDSVFQITQQVFGDFSTETKSLRTLFQNVKHFYPDFKPPVVYTTMTGMARDLMVSDSLFVVSLEFFLAEHCKYKPDMPVYIQKRYRPENIVPMWCLGLSNKFNQVDLLDQTLVAEMVAYGKSYYFIEKTMPWLHDSTIAGYNRAEIEELERNADVVWRHFIDKKLLFEVNPSVVTRYIGERPSVSEIGSKCPGRVGRYLGWQIVRKYMEVNPSIDLVTLMKEKDARKIFNESKYKPVKKS